MPPAPVLLLLRPPEGAEEGAKAPAGTPEALWKEAKPGTEEGPNTGLGGSGPAAPGGWGGWKGCNVAYNQERSGWWAPACPAAMRAGWQGQ